MHKHCIGVHNFVKLKNQQVNINKCEIEILDKCCVGNCTLVPGPAESHMRVWKLRGEGESCSSERAGWGSIITQLLWETDRVTYSHRLQPFGDDGDHDTTF